MAKVVYKSKDGETFKTEGDADAHDKLVAAEQQFNHAVECVRRAFRETAMTADGEPIHCHGWSKYWRVREVFGEKPAIEEISLWSYDVSARVDTSGSDIVFEMSGDSSKSWHRSVRASELYARHANAKRALLKVCEERLAQFTAEVKALRKELAD